MKDTLLSKVNDVECGLLIWMKVKIVVLIGFVTTRIIFGSVITLISEKSSSVNIFTYHT